MLFGEISPKIRTRTVVTKVDAVVPVELPSIFTNRRVAREEKQDVHQVVSNEDGGEQRVVVIGKLQCQGSRFVSLVSHSLHTSMIHS